jgi:ribonuclease Z
MNLELFILGSSSATPTRERHPSAQLLRIENEKILLDCGEGTQKQLMRYGLKHTGIDYICISHLHGDHYFGLIGLISTMSLLGRTELLNIIGPPPLKDIVDMMILHGGMKLKFELNFIFTREDKAELLVETPTYTISSFPLQHRIHCTGFIIREQPKEKHLNMEAIRSYDIAVDHFRHIKAGNDYIGPDGTRIANHLITFEPLPPKSYAYCSDTVFDESIAAYVQGVNMLYHEATYLSLHSERAAQYFHSTAAQAAEIARLAGAGELLIGHFSSRYDHLKPLLDEARQVFPQTRLALEGERFTVRQFSELTV